RDLLKRLAVNHPLYVVTDGHKIVQKNKVDALGITELFKKIYITHRFGIKNAKPSIYCFEHIKRKENCRWSDMAYVGDNPKKDFVNLTPLGVRTIRVLTGVYRHVQAQSAYEAKSVIDNLGQLQQFPEI